MKFFVLLATVSEAGASAPVIWMFGVFEPVSSIVTASPSAKVVVPVLEVKLGVAVSQLFATPSPVQVIGRGWVFVETSRQHCCVHESPAASVTVKRKPPRPEKSSVGVKVTIASPGPDWVVVPPEMPESVKTGLAVKPEVNFRRSISMELGDSLVRFATVPCGTALKCRYSSKRV